MLPALHAAGRARVVSVSSTGHHWSGFDFDDPNCERTDYDPPTAYGRSKTANALFAVELDRRYRDAGIRASSLMPGGIHTSLGRQMTDDIRNRLAVHPAPASQNRCKSAHPGSAPTIQPPLGPRSRGTQHHIATHTPKN